MQVAKYDSSRHDAWNTLVANSRNGNFLFDRRYMEYHADRFTDHSLLFFDQHGALAAVLPASQHGDELVSHGGLTYGGVLSGEDMKTSTMLRLFDSMCRYLADQGISRLSYKAIPHIFHRTPAEEDLYALFRHEAQLYRRDASSAIFLPERMRFAKGKREGVRKAARAGLEVRESADFESFFAIGQKVMQDRHGLTPVHTSQEMAMLAGRFPENIRLHASFQGERMLAGAITYVFPASVHLQYMYNSDAGFDVGALDVVLDRLINDVYAGLRYFSFGVSTEDAGKHLNEGLIHQKEMFGARSVVHDFYQLDIS